MEKNSSEDWLPNTQFKFCFSLPDEDSTVFNPYDLPGDDIRYGILAFLDQIECSRPLEMVQLAANNRLEPALASANQIINTRSLLRLIE